MSYLIECKYASFFILISAFLSLKIFTEYFEIASMSPISTKNPVFPWTLSSGSPPELVDITGVDEIIASNAASPKLSVFEGKRNKSAIFH